MRHVVLSLLLVGAMFAATGYLFLRVPGGLAPAEDQGYVFLVTVLPPAASLERTREVSRIVTEGLTANSAVSDVISFSGFDLLARRKRQVPASPL